jgi:hypothetical protein
MHNKICKEIDPDTLRRTLSDSELALLEMDYDRYEHILKGKVFEESVESDETPLCFNEMGLMQAIDNLRAVKVVLDIIEENNYKINENRIYAYGVSHGAYLVYVCNALWSELFTAVVDNCAYLTPVYLKKPRTVDSFLGDGIQLRRNYTYKALEFAGDEEIYDLHTFYRQFENKAEILCYAGEDDWITPLEDKKAFLNQVQHTEVKTVTKYQANNELFVNAGHGLGTDFMKLFELSNKIFLEPKEKEWKKKRVKHRIACEDTIYETELYRYEVKWEDGIPILSRNPKPV